MVLPGSANGCPEPLEGEEEVAEVAQEVGRAPQPITCLPCKPEAARAPSLGWVAIRKQLYIRAKPRIYRLTY